LGRAASLFRRSISTSIAVANVEADVSQPSRYNQSDREGSSDGRKWSDRKLLEIFSATAGAMPASTPHIVPMDTYAVTSNTTGRGFHVIIAGSNGVRQTILGFVTEAEAHNWITLDALFTNAVVPWMPSGS
jgi:hypothetical protein